MLEQDAINMTREAAGVIERLEKRNEVLEGQLWVLRVLDKALNAGRGESGVGHQWSLADRLKMFATTLEEKVAQGNTKAEPENENDQ